MAQDLTMTLVRDLLTESYEALKAFSYNDCFCDMAIGNPMVHSHTSACQRAQAIIQKIEAMEKRWPKI